MNGIWRSFVLQFRGDRMNVKQQLRLQHDIEDRIVFHIDDAMTDAIYESCMSKTWDLVVPSHYAQEIRDELFGLEQ